MYFLSLTDKPQISVFLYNPHFDNQCLIFQHYHFLLELQPELFFNSHYFKQRLNNVILYLWINYAQPHFRLHVLYFIQYLFIVYFLLNSPNILHILLYPSYHHDIVDFLILSSKYNLVLL